MYVVVVLCLNYYMGKVRGGKGVETKMLQAVHNLILCVGSLIMFVGTLRELVLRVQQEAVAPPAEAGKLGGMYFFFCEAAKTEPRGALFAGALAALLGWRLPVGWLESRMDRRRFEMRSDFPVMLDLLQISMQGGMSLHAAWSATTGSLDAAGDALGREMRRVDMAVGLGMPWGNALVEAADRTGIDEFRSLGSLLGQTQRFGTGVADMIRVLCDSLRHDEVQNLEEQAHRRSVRMVMVLAGMLLPATLLIVIAPLLLMLLDAFKEVTAD